jgi:hypothetical protein
MNAPVSAEHRKELQEIAGGLDDRLAFERESRYAPPKGDGSQLLARSFRAHFRNIAAMLDQRDELVQELDDARQDLWAWMSKRTDGASYALPPLVLSNVVERGRDSLPWVDNDPEYVMLGPYVVPDIKKDDDLAESKRPYGRRPTALRASPFAAAGATPTERSVSKSPAGRLGCLRAVRHQTISNDCSQSCTTDMTSP